MSRRQARRLVIRPACTRITRSFAAVLVLSTALTTIGLTASPARAAGVVSTCDESSLLAALGGGGSVTFSLGGVPCTITLSATISISDDTTIDGSGEDVTISGGGAVQIFVVDAGSSLSLNRLSMVDANNDNNGVGGFTYGGAIANYGDLAITRSELSGNVSSCGVGGAVYNDGTLTVTDSTLSDNHAPCGAGGGGAIFNDGDLTVTTSTISANDTDFGNGGGINNNTGATAEVINSTISENDSAGSFDGSGGGGGIYNDGTITVSNSTIARNGSSSTNGGGGVYSETGGSTTLEGTIVAYSPGGDCEGTVTDGGHNLSSDATCGFTGLSLGSTDPLLGTLADNGGPTFTRMPAADSPAVDVIPSGSPICPGTDQRGVLRPSGAGCDIGAVELETTTADLGISIDEPTTTVMAGQTASFIAVFTNDGPDTATEAQLVIDLGDVDMITTDPGDVGITCGPPGEANDVTCELGDVADEGSGYVNVTFRTSTEPGTTDMTASVSSSTFDDNVDNDSATEPLELTDASPGFAPAQSYDLAGTGAHSVVTGDFDEDEGGTLDVVVSSSDGTASFFAGDGDGGLADATEITLAGTPRWLAAGDVNSDEHLDLIANTENCDEAPTSCGELRFAAGNGDGTFEAPVAIDVANGPASIALADVNDDGDLDLLAADTIDADLSVSIGNGDGTFQETADTYGTAGGRSGIEVGRLDEDDLPDIVVTGGAEALVFLNEGDGLFAAAVSYSTGSNLSDPTPSLADLDEDNAPDLVVSGRWSVLLNAGDGTFGPATEEDATDADAMSVVTGDFNGDGRVDVEAATGYVSGSETPMTDDLVQGRGAGDGTFGSGPSATLQYRVSTSIAKGDLNDDGTPDLIVPHDADDVVTVLIATPTPGISGLVVTHGTEDTFPAGYSPLDQRTLDFAGVDLDPAILSGAAGPLAAPLQGRPLQGRPLQGRPLQGRPLQGRPLQGRPLQGRFVNEPPPSAFSFAPFQALVDHAIVDPPLITQIGLDEPGGWPAQLAGTPLATLPPQEVDLNDVIANTTAWGRVQDITLDRFDLSQTALGNLPPIAELAGSAPLTAFAPASSWTDPGGWLETMAPVCATSISTTNTGQTLVDLALARCPLTVVPWETLRIRDFALTSTNSLLFSYGILGLDPAAIPYQLGANEVTLGDLPLADVPTGIVDCGLIACGGGAGNTLGDAYDLMIADSDYVILPTARFTAFLTGGPTNGGGSATAADLIGDLTTERFLLGAIAPQDFPYVLLSTNQLLDAAPATASGAIPYSAAFDVDCPTPADTTISFRLPNARFGFVRGSANFRIGPSGSATTVPAGNPEVDATVLRWDLPDNATVCGVQVTGTMHVVLDFEVQPAPITGVFNASATVTTGSNDTLRTLDADPITLTESDAGVDPDSPQDIGPNDLVLGQFSSPADVNYYRIPVTQDDVGALVTVVLTNGNDPQSAGIDNDLVIYGTAEDNLAAAPLQGRPLQGRPLGDQEGCLPSGYVLNSQGLEGVPHVDGSGRAVRGFSTNRSDYPEIACTTVQEADLADGILVQVSHFTGSTGDTPYVLSHTVEQVDPTVGCVPPDLQYATDLLQQGQTPTTAQYSRVIDAGDELPSGATTLFVLNAERLGDLYGYDFTGTQPTSIAEKQILDDLQALASRPEVNGYILPVETSGAVQQAYDDLDGNECSPTAANAVVSAINIAIRDVETPPSGPRVRPENVVMVGDDDVVPFARLRDLTTLGNQVAYAPNIHSESGPNPISKAFARGYILSDDPYGTTLAPISFLGNIAYVPDTALGRLIESPEEIHGQIQRYVAVDGVLDPKTRLSTGADFASGVGQQIADTFKDQTDALNDQQGPNPYSTKALLTSATGGTWTAEPGWNKARMICLLDGSDAASGCTRATVPDFDPPGVISVSGHANHVSTLAGNGIDVVDTDDIAGISRLATDGTSIPNGSLLFTIGCNAGVNVPDSYLPAPDEFDLPQALASRKGSMVGNFGFGYGDTTRLAFSEKLMKLFADNLDGSVTIGQAIVQAKGSYWSQLVTSSPYDVKSLEQSTLYGLPFYRITGTGNTNANNAPPVITDPDTGLSSSVLTLPKPNTNDDFFVDPVNDRRSGGSDGEFFVGPNAQVVPGQPIQPTSNPFFLTQPGLRLHGALITELSVQDITGLDPVIARLVLDGSPGAGTEPIVQSGIFPSAYSTLTTVQGNDYIVLNGGRFTFTGEDLGNQRVHTQETARALYSSRTETDFTAPDVSAAGQLIGGGYATFTIRSLATDVAAAYVMYRPGGGPNVNEFQLVRLLPTSPTVYSATVQVGTNGVSEFFGEVADIHGNVGFDFLKAAGVALQTVNTSPPPNVTTRIIPDAGTVLDPGSGFYSGPVDVEIVQRSFASIQAQVDFGATQTFSPATFFSGTTARVDVPSVGSADGVHRVDYTTAGRTATVVVGIDGLPPDIQYQIGVPNSGTGSGAPYVTPGTAIGIVVTDTSSGVQDCTIERYFPPSSTSPQQTFICDEGNNPVTLGNADGRYRFRTVATDNAGHSIVRNEVITVTRDDTPPTVTPSVGTPRFPAVSPTPYVTTPTDITMTIEDPPADDVAGSGVASCSTMVVGPIPSGGPEPASSNAGCDPLTGAQTYHATGLDGTYRFDTTATDRLGNEGSGTQTVRLDNTEPTVNLTRTGPPFATTGTTTFVNSSTPFRNATADPASVSGPGSGVASCDTTLATTGTTAPGIPATLPVPAACSTPSTTFTFPSSTPDGPYRITGTADDNVGNHNGGAAGGGGSGPLDVTLDNTPPAFGQCPTANPGTSARLISSISNSSSATTLKVLEGASPPHVRFVLTVDPGTAVAERMLVTKRVAGSGAYQFTYTVQRAFGGGTRFAHAANAPVSWNLPGRIDVLGVPNAAVGGAAGDTTFPVKAEPFGMPATPFLAMVGNEQVLVQSAAATATPGIFTFTVVRGYSGTAVTTHPVTDRIVWSGPVYGRVQAAATATATSITVDEGTYGPTSVPFEITVGAERMTVVARTATATPGRFTYSVARSVDGTKGVAHSAGESVWTPAVATVYLNSPAQTLAIPVTDGVYPGVTGSGIDPTLFSASGPSAFGAPTFDAGSSTLRYTLTPTAVGTFAVLLTAGDLVGNTSAPLAGVTGATTNPAQALCRYEVVYKFSGLDPKLKNDSLNAKTAGSTIELRWRITDYNGVPVASNNASFVEVTVSAAKACDTVPDFATTADHRFRTTSNIEYEGGGTYEFKWLTLKAFAPSCRTMNVRLAQSGLSGPSPIPGSSVIPDPSRRYGWANVQFKTG